MNLDKRQREQLQNILTHADFPIVEHFLLELAKEIGVRPVLNTTEWDHTKGSMEKEHQIALLRDLVSLMESAASQGDNNG